MTLKTDSPLKQTPQLQHDFQRRNLKEKYKLLSNQTHLKFLTPQLKSSMKLKLSSKQQTSNTTIQSNKKTIRN
ncbi:FAD-binding protein [Sesbania bispinosa]|nr:FAD-binding protein [Sesbania bispinosa]